MPTAAPVLEVLSSYAKTLGEVYDRSDLTIAWQTSAVLAREIERLQQAEVSPAAPLGDQCPDRVVVTVRGIREGRRAEYLVSGEVRVMGAGYRAARTLRSGIAIAAEDLVLEEGSIPPSASFDPGKDVEGLYLSRGTAAGQWVSRGDLKEPPLVRRGEAMLVIYRGTGIELRGRGVARRDAWLGDRIGVRVDGAERDCEARVVGLGQAQVHAS